MPVAAEDAAIEFLKPPGLFNLLSFSQVATAREGKIQEESLYYEHKKHDGSYPIVGVNTFRNPDAVEAGGSIPLQRSTEEEKQSQIHRLREFQKRNAAEAPAALEKLK